MLTGFQGHRARRACLCPRNVPRCQHKVISTTVTEICPSKPAESNRGENTAADGTVSLARSKQMMRRLLHSRLLHSLQYKSFRYLWFSTLFASAGNWIQLVTVGWLTYELTQSAFMTGAVHALRSLPFLFISPFGGAIADRVNRRSLMIVSQVFLACASLVFALLVLSGKAHVWHLLLFSLISGCAWAVNHPVRQALVVNTVPAAALANAVALNSTAFNVTRLIGPAIGGILIALFGAGTNFLIQALAYGLVCKMALGVQIDSGETPAGSEQSMAGSTLQGFVYVWRYRRILGLMFISFIPALLLLPFTSALLPVFAQEQIGVGASGLGWLMSAFGVGAFVGTVTLALLTNQKIYHTIQVGSLILAGCSLTVLGVTHAFAIALIILVISGYSQMISSAINQTILQSLITDEYRGRVSGIYMLSFGFVPLGCAVGGWAADHFGVSAAMITSGATTIVVILVAAYAFKLLQPEDDGDPGPR